ncbi:MAG: cation-transporting P-type ATPase, partial [Planctomycetota bacterium]
MTARDEGLSRSAPGDVRERDATRPRWHDRPVEEVLRLVDARPAGLSGTEAAGRLDRLGPNRLPEAPRAGPLARFFRQFHNLLIYVLLAAAAVTAVLGHFVDTGV